jgi:hypothetical protein
MDDVPIGLLAHSEELGSEGDIGNELHGAGTESSAERLHVRHGVWVHDTLGTMHSGKRAAESAPWAGYVSDGSRLQTQADR